MLVIGVGNEMRNDDAVGLHIARRLKEMRLPDTVVVESTGDGAQLIDLWSRAEMCLVFDAAESGAAPGTIHEFEAGAQKLPARTLHSSSHQFGVAEAIEVSRSLGKLPHRLAVYAVEGKDFHGGSEMSPEVKAGADEAINQALALFFPKAPR
jgi:hydrogenase maturation protease